MTGVGSRCGRLTVPGIVFTGGRDLYMIDADGSNRQQLTADGGWSPAWSPDSTRITFTRYIRTHIVVMDRDGSDQRVVAYDALDPSWSADAARIAFSADGNVHTVDSHGADRRQVTRKGGWKPAWSPDGHLIAFTRDGEIFTVRPDGTGERQVTSEASVRVPPVWSPDSRLIAYTDGDDLVVIAVDGTDVRRLTYGGGRDPAWSPDSSRLAFTSRVGDLDELFVIAVDGTERRQLTEGGGWDPAWSPDGSRIAFSSRAEVDQSGGIEGHRPEVDRGLRRPGQRGGGSGSPSGDQVFLGEESGLVSPTEPGSSSRTGRPGGLSSIEPDGTGRMTLTRDPAYYPVWSPASR